MKTIITLIFLISALTNFGQAKQVCISIDDLPVVAYGISDSTYQQALFNKVVSTLTNNHVPAIGFVNEMKVYKGDDIIPYQLELLRHWSKSGLELGNHTFSHPDYNKVSFDEYTANIIQGEKNIKSIAAENNKSVRYFRHPFLHVGNNREKADSLSNFLAAHDYLAAPVTIDNEDYLFAVAYKRTQDKNDTALMHQIGRDYITYMEKKLRYYETQSANLFGRPIRQILLIHLSALNSDYLEGLIAMYKANDYTFGSMSDALEDPVYETPITVYGNWGISWIDKWALSAGKKSEFFKDEPLMPEYIENLAK